MKDENLDDSNELPTTTTSTRRSTRTNICNRSTTAMTNDSNWCGEERRRRRWTKFRQTTSDDAAYFDEESWKRRSLRGPSSSSSSSGWKRRNGHSGFYDRSRLIFMIGLTWILWCAFTSGGAYALPNDADSSMGQQQQQSDSSAKAAPAAGGAPVITEHPLDITVPKNDPVTLNCKATGKPQPQIIWYKDGELLSTAAEESSSHRVLLSTGALFFLRVQPGGAVESGNRKNQKSDAGVYWCVARNSHGEARSKNASLRIAYLKDEFRARPKNVQAVVGQEAILECAAPKGFPEPVIYWKKDNRELRLDENDERRRIVQPSAHQQQGQGANGQQQQGAGVGNLIITDVDSSDAGFYTCVARNLVGTRESNPARLTVYAKPKIVRKPENVTATLNEDIMLACKMDGDPPPVITWRKKWAPKEVDKKLPVGRATQLENRGLRIERVTAADEGEYECSGKNPAGSAEASAYLTVYSPPVFTVQPKDRTVEEGALLDVQCEAFGNPTPTKFWSREGNQDPLFPGVSSPDRRMEVTANGTLRIYNVHASDEGYYVCSALNNIGSSSAKMYLKVIGGAVAQKPPPPLIVRGPANQTLPETSLAILPCTASGRTIPRLAWLKDGKELETDVRYTVDDMSGALKLHELRTSDSGIYTCRVYNEDGEDRWSASLVVAKFLTPDVVMLRMPEPSTFPAAPGRPQPLNVSDTSIYLEWEIPKQTGASAIIGYRLHYFRFGSKKDDDSTTPRWISASGEGGGGDTPAGPAQIRGTRYLVQRLTPAASYVFVVRAENQHGVSEPSPYSTIIRTKSTGLGGGGGGGGYGGVGSAANPRDADFDLELARTRLTSSQLVSLREVAPLNATAVKLSWKILQHEPLINGYYVRWQAQDERERGGSLNVPGGASATSAIVGNLRAFTTYKFFVRPYYRTVEGTPSNMYDATTKEAPPSMPPTDVQVRLMNLTTLRISWLPPPANSVNGILKGYEIAVLGNDTLFDRNLTTTERAASVTIFRLIPSMMYRVKVAAATNAGVGVFHGEEEVTMDDATFRRHLAMDKGADSANGDTHWSKSWWFIAILCGIAWFIALAAGLAIYLHCKRSYKKGVLMNGGGNPHRNGGQHGGRFGGGGLPFIKINDGSVAREALWMDHQPEQYYTRGSGSAHGVGVNNSTLLMNGSYGGGDGGVRTPLDGNPAAMANNFTGSTFMANAGGGGKDEKRYTELNQMNILANGGQYYQPPSTPIYHQVSPPSPTPYATTTLVMNAHRQRLLEQGLLEQQQRADNARRYPSSTLHRQQQHHQTGGFDDYPLTPGQQHMLLQQLQHEQEANGMKRAASLRSDQQTNSQLLLNGISPPHTDVSYVSSNGSGSGKLGQRNKQPVLFDFLPPPPAQPPPIGPPAGYEPSGAMVQQSIDENGRRPPNGFDKVNSYYSPSPASGRAGIYQQMPSTSAAKASVVIPTPRTRTKGRPQQQAQDPKQRHYPFNGDGLDGQDEFQNSPPAYDQAMRYFEGNGGAISPTQSDWTSRQVHGDDSPRTSCYGGGGGPQGGEMGALESKRSSMLASLATSDDGDNMIHGMNGYGPGTSSCNSDADDDQSAVDERHTRRPYGRSTNHHHHGAPAGGKRRFYGGGGGGGGAESEFSGREEADDVVDDDGEEDDEDDDEYETHFLPPAEFTQALASRSLLNPGSGASGGGGGSGGSSNSGAISPQYRTQPPMGISASTLLSSQHGTKLSPIGNNYAGGRLNSLPRHSSATSAAVRSGHRGKGPTDVV